MPRVPRSVLPDGVFHVTARGVADEAIYRDDDDRLQFVDLLQTTRVRHAWACHAYCLMTTHYHLLVATSRLKLSLGLRRLNGVYAQRFNRRHGRRGHLFGDRFWASVVEDDHDVRATRYILLNPVRAGLCELPEEWRWSWSRYGTAV